LGPAWAHLDAGWIMATSAGVRAAMRLKPFRNTASAAAADGEFAYKNPFVARITSALQALVDRQSC